MEDDEFIFSIREKTLQDVYEKRSIHRTSALNANRNNFDEIERSLTNPSFTEFQELCIFHCQKKKDRDLHRIRLGLGLGPAFISAFHDTDGALYSLVSSLTGGTPTLQIEALYCLINMGVGNEKQCSKVCNMVGTYLISLGFDNTILQELCLWAFGNLCGGHPRVCLIAQKQGLEEAIIRSLSSQASAVIQSASYALNHYLHSVHNRLRQFCTADVIRLIMKIELDDSLTTQHICWSLFGISSQRFMCSILVDMGFVPFALRTLDVFTVKMKEYERIVICTPLVRGLTNCIASCNSVAIELCYQSNLLVPVCCRLLASSQSFLIKETIQLIANIFNAAEKQSITGEKVLEDSNLKKRLEPHLRLAFSSHFELFQEAGSV